MTGLTVLKEIAYASSSIERELETALAAVGVDLPRPDPLKLEDYTDLGCHTSDLWRGVALQGGKTIKYLKALNVFTDPAFDIRKVPSGIYLDALQQAFSGGSLKDETVFFQEGNRELMLYHEFEATRGVYLSGDLELLCDAAEAYYVLFGEMAEANEFISKCRSHDIKNDGLGLTEQETSKIINAVVYYLSSSSDGPDSS
jgi:hypothetical protein